MANRSFFSAVKSFLGVLLGLVLYLVIGGLVIYFLFHGCEGDHRYMNVGQAHGRPSVAPRSKAERLDPGYDARCPRREEDE